MTQISFIFINIFSYHGFQFGGRGAFNDSLAIHKKCLSFSTSIPRNEAYSSISIFIIFVVNKIIIHHIFFCLFVCFVLFCFVFNI